MYISLTSLFDHYIQGGTSDGSDTQAGTATSANIATAPIVPSDSSESITINGRTFILAPKLPNATGNL